MLLTPTLKGQLAAGGAFWATLWLVASEIEEIARVCRVSRWVKKEPVFEWITTHKTLAFLLTEVINYARVDTESPAGICFAVGGSFINATIIFLLLPFRKTVKRFFGSLCFWRAPKSIS